MGPRPRLIRLEANAGAIQAYCHQCGNVGLALTRTAAQLLVDKHRAQAHPRQATYVESKRRARSRSVNA